MSRRCLNAAADRCRGYESTKPFRPAPKVCLRLQEEPMSKKTPANDPMVGTWKLNLSKSTYIPGPAPKSAINKFEPREDGMKATIDMVDGQGNKFIPKPPSNSMARTIPSRGLRLLTLSPS